MASLLNMSGGSLLKKGLPYDAEIEYLESTKTQYIDTGIKAQGNLSIKINTFDYFNSSHLGVWLFGGRNGYGNKMFQLFIDGLWQEVSVGYNDKFPRFEKYSFYPASTDYVEIGGGVIKIGSYQYTYSLETFTSDYNVILFGLQDGSNPRISSFKIGHTYISDGTITRDFIPVRIGQVGYMYDKVSKQLFGNAGTGDFILGPDKTN